LQTSNSKTIQLPHFKDLCRNPPKNNHPVSYSAILTKTHEKTASKISSLNESREKSPTNIRKEKTLERVLLGKFHRQ